MEEFTPQEDISELSDFRLDEYYQENQPLAEKPTGKEIEEFDKALDQDFKTVRDNLIKIVQEGEVVLEDMIQLAKGSDHPRAFEVVATLISTLTESNKDLLDIYEKKNKIRKGRPEDEKPTTQNNTQNNIYVGSTADLLSKILEKKKDE